MGDFSILHWLIIGGVIIVPGIIWVNVVMRRGRKRGEREKAQAVARREQERTEEIERRRDEEHQRALELASASARVVHKEKIVERQVLVMHCKYCKKLTPADLTECEHCGARQ